MSTNFRKLTRKCLQYHKGNLKKILKNFEKIFFNLETFLSTTHMVKLKSQSDWGTLQLRLSTCF